MSRQRKRPYDDQKKWNKLRVARFAIDNGQCQSGLHEDCYGELTLEKHQPNTVALAHVKNWVEHYDLRHEITNLRSECAKCNGLESFRRKRDEGFKLSDTRIVLVIGPPPLTCLVILRRRLARLTW